MSESFELKWSMYDSTKIGDRALIDCSIENKTIIEEDCLKRKCVFNKISNEQGMPSCTIPSGKGGYSLEKTLQDQAYELKKADDFSLFKKDAQKLQINFSQLKTNGFNLARVKITDPTQTRYEVPLKLNYQTSEGNKFAFDLRNSASNSAAYMEIKSNGRSLFDTRGIEQGLVYSDQFIQIVLNLHYKNVYGFGENTHVSFKHKFDYSTSFYPVFARDQPPGDPKLNLYGTHPFLMAIDEKTGRTFGLFILNSNAMEYGFIPPQAFSYRTMGGILDFYVFEEETPELVIQAYTSLIGKPYLPPYWSLGFQLCRYGYNSIEKLQAAVNRTRQALIPHDVQYADIDHFDRQLDFTYDKVKFKGLPEYIKYLNSTGLRFIIILDPAINSEIKDYGPFLSGTKDDVWIKWPSLDNPQKNEINGNNQYMLGYVWPEGKTVFPDFFKEETKKWWSKEIVSHFKQIPFDGLWIDMNEPANFDTNEEKPWNWPADRPAWNLFCSNDSSLDNPDYLPLAARPYGNTKKLSDKTVCMIGTQNDGKYTHYDVHNLYGWSQTEPTLNALREATNLRGIVISRSTYPSSGTMSGHWLGDNTSQWNHLKSNVIGLLEFNLFGIPYIGADICGFFGDTTPEMCQRWMQMGAFNTFYRNHNGFNGIDQDPAALGAQVAHASREVTEIRYSLLPHLYTLFYTAHTNGGTVIRSLAHEFPSDSRALDVDRQFLWGSSLLISPVLDINKRTVVAYFPSARWFDYYDGCEISETGRSHELNAPLDHISLHVRGGSILVTQNPSLNTRLSRQNAFGLIVAPDQANKATGELYWDGGEEINPAYTHSFFKISYSNDIIMNTIIKDQFDFSSTNRGKIDSIRIFGIYRRPTRIIIDQGMMNRNFTYNSLTKELTIKNADVSIHRQFKISIAYN